MFVSLKNALVLTFLLLTAACSAVPNHVPLNEVDSDKAQIEGYPAEIRFWADEAPKNTYDLIMRRIMDYRYHHADYFKKNKKYPDLNYLAISGGAYDGAFGAGLLNGWTVAGTRPDFTLVTGVSTGALIAPFVFVGPKYDATMKELFTTTNSDNVFMTSVIEVLDGITGGLALTDSTPLQNKIRQYITADLMDEIAQEHRKGRRLFIGTSNLEAQRGVIWDIGAIANSGNPDALYLIQQVMLASAAIPGAFSPVFINVKVGGKQYNEMHVDGGVTAQTFLYPIKIRRSVVQQFIKSGLKRHVYIVRNSKITPEYKVLEPGFFAITRRSIETIAKNEGMGDLYRLYLSTQRDGIDYNLAYIPSSFQAEPKELFDPEYMSKLFDVGYDWAMQRDAWEKTPPGLNYIPEN